MNFSTAGGRRYVLVWALMLIASGLLWCGKLGPGDWVAVMSISVCAYIAGNTAQRYVEARGRHET